MAFFRKIVVTVVIVGIAGAGTFAYWAQQPIINADPAVPFAILPGSGAHAAGQQMANDGVPMQPFLFNLLSRLTLASGKLKAGSYELKPGTTPLGLIDQLVRGDFAQDTLTIIEGWTFRQMRQAVALNRGLKHDTTDLSDEELMAQVAPEFKHPEGLFFPDTYLFPKGSSELVIYKKAHAEMMSHLTAAWNQRSSTVPYKTPYEALTMASIIEKETGQKSERGMIAAVFVNRLRLGMLLQTDPTVIYGMGSKYEGKIRKKDLETDTPYNTYTRAGLPPTPISLPGKQSLAAAMAPDKSTALYFVSRGNGTSQFSENLIEHNRAVNQYQR